MPSPKPLTERRFKAFMGSFEEGLAQKFTTKEDLAQIDHKIDRLTNNLDKYLKRTEDWSVELKVLRSRYDRLVDVLTEKHIVSEDELAVG